MLYFACRAVYENNLDQEFNQKLQGRVKAYDKDIERLCNYHYHGFIESVSELLRVKTDVRNLKVSKCSYNRSIDIISAILIAFKYVK